MSHGRDGDFVVPAEILELRAERDALKARVAELESDNAAFIEGSEDAADAVLTAEAALKVEREAHAATKAAAQRALHPSCVAEFHRAPKSPAVCHVCEQIQSAALAICNSLNDLEALAAPAGKAKQHEPNCFTAVDCTCKESGR